MAMTSDQQNQINVVKELIADFQTTCLDTSPSIYGMVGNYMFDQFNKINAAVGALEDLLNNGTPDAATPTPTADALNPTSYYTVDGKYSANS